MTATLSPLALFFPGILSDISTSYKWAPPQRLFNKDWCGATKIIRPQQVERALYKCPGEDNITRHATGHQCPIPHLVKIYRASLAYRNNGQCPEFISKAGREDYSLVTSFRPICLTLFLLKAMEKVTTTILGLPF